MQDWKGTLGALVFDTDSDTSDIQETMDPDTALQTLSPKVKQRIHLRMERKGRGGKTVTIVAGYIGTDDEIEVLAARIKQRCGVGGAVKDGEIVIQGDRRQQIRTLLESEGMQVKG